MRNDASPASDAPKPTRLADYAPPAYFVDRIRLDVSLDPKCTIVRSRVDFRRGAATPEGAPLVLDGEQLELLSLKIDGQPVDASRYLVGEKSLTLDEPPAAFTLEVETACSPEANTALSGLYLSNGMFCTQCEAEGFRRITFFPDRPDVLARYTVRVEGDRETAPVLLANGNLIDKGDAGNGRHFAVWEDPHPKPSYLFALVGGDLACAEDEFVTRSGRRVALKVYVQPKNKDKCAYTLDSLKRAMRWDEEAFGREYDLDIFMIVAVDHFNFGAMENKGLNIFNSAYVLASPETATDDDYEAIESIVAHEYFHNWSGNRVTCRDWFQLSLKEGFTVFRDQEFSADMRSRPVQRIRDVRRLWSAQFPEDAGPLAHPVQPAEYITIDNFYTATVYEKGAELVRMMKTLLGEERFRKGCDLYFSRHDGTAATVEDFVRAMEEAGDIDLAQFRRWYSDAGTPQVCVKERSAGGELQLDIAQRTPPTPGQSEKPPRHIPIAYAIYGAESGARLGDGLIELKEARQTVDLGKVGERPVVSLLTAFSAPVVLERAQSLDDRLTLAARDEDLFNRWAAVEGLWRDLCLAVAGVKSMNDVDAALSRFAEALEASLRGADDKALTAELLRCPAESDLARHVESLDPGPIVAARKQVRARVSALIGDALREAYDGLRSNAPFEPSAEQAGERALKNAALSLLVAGGDGALALDQAKTASNMTDEAAATAALAASAAPERAEALERFYARWNDDALVANKWLAWNALTPDEAAGGGGALAKVKSLLDHPAYDAKTPNKVRSLIGAFARENIAGFHRADGAGYAFLADQLLLLDRLNPQLAARLSAALDAWRRLEPGRREKAENALKRVAETKGVSANLYEMTSRILAG